MSSFQVKSLSNFNLICIPEGEPRFELLKNDKVVDTIRTGRYDIDAFKKLCKDLGLKRDESETWEKR
jgi:hypothetical protein